MNEDQIRRRVAAAILKKRGSLRANACDALFLLKFAIIGKLTENSMRVVCPHCHTRALITSSNAMTEQVKDLYCQCTNTKDCGASFVFTLAYKHDLNPPQKTTLQIAATLINNLQPAQRKQLQVDLFG